MTRFIQRPYSLGNVNDKDNEFAYNFILSCEKSLQEFSPKKKDG